MASFRMRYRELEEQSKFQGSTLFPGKKGLAVVNIHGASHDSAHFVSVGPKRPTGIVNGCSMTLTTKARMTEEGRLKTEGHLALQYIPVTPDGYPLPVKDREALEANGGLAATLSVWPDSKRMTSVQSVAVDGPAVFEFLMPARTGKFSTSRPIAVSVVVLGLGAKWEETNIVWLGSKKLADAFAPMRITDKGREVEVAGSLQLVSEAGAAPLRAGNLPPTISKFHIRVRLQVSCRAGGEGPAVHFFVARHQDVEDELQRRVREHTATLSRSPVSFILPASDLSPYRLFESGRMRTMDQLLRSGFQGLAEMFFLFGHGSKSKVEASLDLEAFALHAARCLQGARYDGGIFSPRVDSQAPMKKQDFKRCFAWYL